jgi:hypothetical protein
MSEQNTEITNNTEVKPVPPTPTTQVETKVDVVAAPVNNPTEYDKKATAAFIKQRQEIREMKRKLAEVTAANPAHPVIVEKLPDNPQEVTVTPPTQVAAPAPRVAEVDIDAESAKAIEGIASDADVSKVPGGVLDIINLVDTDPRLARLHNIDPTIAFREAKNIWLAKTGIGQPPPIPKDSTPVGGQMSAPTNFEALNNELMSTPPGSKRFYELAKQVRAARSALINR